jgi:hypothetical protein
MGSGRVTASSLDGMGALVRWLESALIKCAIHATIQMKISKIKAPIFNEIQGAFDNHGLFGSLYVCTIHE